MSSRLPVSILVTTHYPPLVGGAATYFSLLAQGLAARGRRVIVLTTMVAGQPWSMRDGNVRVVRLIPELGRVPNIVRKVVQTAVTAKLLLWFRLQGPIHVIHTHASKSVTVGSVIASVLTHTPIVFDVQDFLSRPKVITRGVARRYVATGRPIKEHLRSLGIPDESIATIASVPPDATRLSLPDRSDNPIVHFLFVGELHHEIKGSDILLKAFALVHQRDPEAHLTMIGDGPDAEVDRRSVSTLGLRNSVTLTGAVKPAEVYRLMDGADVLVMASRTEGMPRVILEAFARGLPVVATRVGGIPEVVLDGQNGLLVPPNDAVALSEAMMSLILDAPKRIRFGLAGHDWVMTQPTWHDLVATIDAHYGR